MFSSTLGCPERKETNSQTSKCRFKNLKIHELLLCPGVENPCQLHSCFPHFLADLDKKYRNKIEMDKS